MNIEQAIAALIMLRELMLFDPNTGEVYPPESLNEDNRNLYDAAEIAIDALREKAERENPKPLTLEELKDRHGKPIYAVDGEGHACWVVVNAFDEECADNEFGAWQFFYYDMQDCTKDELHPMGWLAYDHEPKEAHK